MNNEANPFFSIIIPTYNRPECLEKCLDALARQKDPKDSFEIIVVDDGSLFSPAGIVDSFREKTNISLLSESHKGPAAARNRGAACARGQFLAFTDDDCRPCADWLTKLNHLIEKFPNHAITGCTINALNNIYSETSQLLVGFLYQYYNTNGANAQFVTSNNFCVPKNKFIELNGFDEGFVFAGGEDRDFCSRWLENGQKIHFDPSVQIYHYHSLTLRSFWRQHFHYGRAAHRYHKNRAARKSGWIKLERSSFYFRLLAYPWTNETTRGSRLVICFLLIVSQAANAFGFFWETMRWKKEK